jgi:hypothetical protein
MRVLLGGLFIVLAAFSASPLSVLPSPRLSPALFNVGAPFSAAEPRLSCVCVCVCV